MIVTRRSGATVAALVLIFVLLQNTFFSQVEFLGAPVWLLPVVAVTFGLMGGSLLGATIGFGLGFFADALGDSPLGLGCLTFMAIGYLGGFYRERSGRADHYSVVGLSAAAVLGANLAFGAFGLLGGMQAPLSWGALPDILLQSLFGALVALPTYAVIYRVLRPALILEAPSTVTRQPRTGLAGAATEVDHEV
ncbi:MAG: hypothetical protein M9938_08265 [Solirubrobacterales bacterium]|nr:hypothetical protein [Solirubrobacterales bacterium]